MQKLLRIRASRWVFRAVAYTLVSAFVCGCSCGRTSEPTNGAGGGGGTNSGGPLPTAAATLRTHIDLIETVHLADISHHGLYIDFGTPSARKYTVGGWRTGWLREGVDGDDTYAHAGERARFYFDARQSQELFLSLRMKPIGSRRAQVFVNGTALPDPITLEVQGEPQAGQAMTAPFQDVVVPLPASLVRAGENAIMLVFGATVPVQGEAVSMAVASARVSANRADLNGDYRTPSHGTLVRSVSLSDVERRSIAVSAPSEICYYVEIPRTSPRLVFGLGADGQGSVNAEVKVTAEGENETIVWSGSASNAWSDHSADLAPFAGKVIRLCLVGRAEHSARIAWSAPQIMVEPYEAPSARPVKNAVVLLVDTLRASKLRPYNPQSRVRTPVFDELVSHGVLFERAQSQENWTKPSVASVLTGLTPMTHQAKTTEARLSTNVEMVSETLNAANFATGTFLANGYVSDRFGFNQGWDFYTNFIRENRSTRAEDVFREAGNFIEQHKDERFFVYIQTIDPHVPYDPPAEYLAMYDTRTDYAGQVQARMTADLLERAKRTPPGVTFDASDVRRLEALHDGDISYHDHFLGEFMTRLRTLGVADDTLLVITSDHGEEFNDHGSWGHGHSVYQELLNVPLFVHRPGVVPEGERRPQTVSTLSVSPTVISALGVDGLAHAEGRSLWQETLGAPAPGFSVAFSEFADDRRVIRAGRYKLIVRANTRTAFFDLETDPHEEHDLPLQRLPIAARYTRILIGQYLGAPNRRQWLSADAGESAPQVQRENAQMDDTLRDQLRALGYGN